MMAETMDLQSRLSASSPLKRMFLGDQLAMHRQLKRTQKQLREADATASPMEIARLETEVRGIRIQLRQGREFQKAAGRK